MKFDHQEFEEKLRTALNALYDPARLRKSPFVGWLGLDQATNTANALQKAILEGIEALRPRDKTPSGSKSWRIYQILRRRYTEQVLQNQVADDLGLSLRQMQREEKDARELLAHHIWKNYRLDEFLQRQTQPSPQADPSTGNFPNPIYPGDLEQLSTALPYRRITLDEVVREARSTLREVVQRTNVRISYQPADRQIYLHLNPEFLRLALLNVLNVLILQIPNGSIRLAVQMEDENIQIYVEAYPAAIDSPPALNIPFDILDTAQTMLRLCNGTLSNLSQDQSSSPVGLNLVISLPIPDRTTVLIIEDHEDTLQLYSRYLADSPYRFLGAASPQQGLALAISEAPRIIIIDVMMPVDDGWSVLSRLRAHPATHQIPVIMCSVVPQGNLAQSLGAVAFLRKPVSRTDLLSELDRQMRH
jgi:CheY-like chemotaxis protein